MHGAERSFEEERDRGRKKERIRKGEDEKIG
jgi:hypothetical protein